MGLSAQAWLEEGELAGLGDGKRPKGIGAGIANFFADPAWRK